MPLKIAGFKEEFTYPEENIPHDINKENKKYSQKNRKRKIIWFNHMIFVDLLV